MHLQSLRSLAASQVIMYQPLSQLIKVALLKSLHYFRREKQQRLTVVPDKLLIHTSLKSQGKKQLKLKEKLGCLIIKLFSVCMFNFFLGDSIQSISKHLAHQIVAECNCVMCWGYNDEQGADRRGRERHRRWITTENCKTRFCKFYEGVLHDGLRAQRENMTQGGQGRLC